MEQAYAVQFAGAADERLRWLLLHARAHRRAARLQSIRETGRPSFIMLAGRQALRQAAGWLAGGVRCHSAAFRDARLNHEIGKVGWEVREGKHLGEKIPER